MLGLKACATIVRQPCLSFYQEVTDLELPSQCKVLVLVQLEKGECGDGIVMLHRVKRSPFRIEVGIPPRWLGINTSSELHA